VFQRILIIFENENICGKALSYARELAVRMDSDVALLMLVEMAFLDRAFVGSKRSVMRELEARIGGILGDLSSEFLKKGIPVSAALRVGDAAQELLKFLAERRPFQALIWGSSEELPEGNPQRKSHWIKKVVDRLECPLLAVGSGESASRLARK
jgi:nucleotide-binding universal stress UspA family protein